MKHTTTRVLSLILTVLLCFAMFAPAGAAGGETVTVRIPVSCTGADCTAVLYDSNDVEVGRLALQKGVTAYFEVECAGLKDFTYTLKLAEQGTVGRVTYDTTEYTVTVMVYRVGDTVKYVITAEPGVVYHPDDAAKCAELKFVNKTSGTPPQPDPTVNVTVTKEWVGDTEADRPASINVQLTRNGVNAQTATLSAATGWTHIFENLSAKYTYGVKEIDPPAGYASHVIKGASGNTFTIVNEKTSATDPWCWDDPPVDKQIRGNPPSVPVFTFILTPDDPAYPMPAGSAEGKKEVQIHGAGEIEIGIIIFTKPGTYTYKVVERQDNGAGWTYDQSVYHVEYVITRMGNDLVCSRTITEVGATKPSATALFVNTYRSGSDDPGKPDEPHLPQTGTYLWAVPLMTGAGCALVGAGALLRRRTDDDNVEEDRD